MTGRSESQKPWKKNSQGNGNLEAAKRNRIANGWADYIMFFADCGNFDDLIAGGNQ